MIEEYEPDGCLAAAMAALSFEDAVVLFNGPCGCYNMIAGTAYRHIPKSREGPIDNRMECLFIEEDDFVFGTAEKVNQALDSIEGTGYGLAVLMDSPGVSVTGDVNWSFKSRTESPLLHVETPMASKDFVEGFDKVVSQILRVCGTPEKHEKERPSVNLLGCCPSYLGWRESVAELTALLDSAGVDVASTPGCGGRFSDLSDAMKADLNIPVIPEYCRRSCRIVENMGGPGTLRNAPVPIGHSATVSWIEAVCDELGTDPSEAVSSIRSKRRSLSDAIRASYYREGFEGRRFATELPASVSNSLSSWLEDYLGMIRSDPGSASFVYGSGYTERRSPESDARFIPLEFLPRAGGLFIPRQVLGPTGTLYLVEETYAGLRSNPAVSVWNGMVYHHMRTTRMLDDLPSDPVDPIKHPVVDDILRSAYSVHDAGLLQDYHPIRILRSYVEVMAYHDDRLRCPSGQSLQHLGHIDLMADIEIGGRLIQYQQLGIADQTSRDRHLLTLPC